LEVKNVPKKVILHCSATPNHKHISVQEIDAWHKARGWQGIGYHYVIYVDGETMPGRPEYEQGAHCKGENKNSIGVCLIGTDRFGEMQVHSLVRLYMKMALRYGINWDQWKGHYEFANKHCPGIDMNVVRHMFKLKDDDIYGL